MLYFLLTSLHTNLKDYVKGYQIYFVFTGKENELDWNSNDQGTSDNISEVYIYGNIVHLGMPLEFPNDTG